MLVIPVTGKAGWRNPPVVTITLILINCLVFFIFQFNEDQRFFEAQEYYFSSGLADIEISRYANYRQAAAGSTAASKAGGRINKRELSGLYREMRRDAVFLEKLKNDEIITPRDPDYARWKELRQNHDDLLGRITTLKYGFVPARARPLTFLTHMFLHGGIEHLLGNMIFLWLVGCMLEMGCGRIFYSLTYILTGLCAVTLFWLIYPRSSIPLVGASGAIAGLMGAFSVLYNRQKVKIFYSLGFYFNYISIPAIVLLPVWIANEFVQLFFFGGASHVAYVAHIGGLISGAALGLINLKFLGAFNAAALQPELDDEISPLMEKALECIGRLDLDGGRHLLEEILARDPGHLGAMNQLFNVRKVNPRDPGFHQIARKLLEYLCAKNANPELAAKIYDEYLSLARRPRLSPQLHLKMSNVFTALEQPEKAARILALFLRHRPDFPGVPAALLRLSQGYRRKGLLEKYRKCLQVIRSKYPESTESQIAAGNLKQPLNA